MLEIIKRYNVHSGDTVSVQDGEMMGSAGQYREQENGLGNLATLYPETSISATNDIKSGR